MSSQVEEEKENEAPFLVDLFQQLADSPKMTAQEVMRRVEEDQDQEPENSWQRFRWWLQDFKYLYGADRGFEVSVDWLRWTVGIRIVSESLRVWEVSLNLPVVSVFFYVDLERAYRWWHR